MDCDLDMQNAVGSLTVFVMDEECRPDVVQMALGFQTVGCTPLLEENKIIVELERILCAVGKSLFDFVEQKVLTVPCKQRCNLNNTAIIQMY